MLVSVSLLCVGVFCAVMSAANKKKHVHFLHAAMRCAGKSQHMRHSHGAVLVKNSKIIATGCNSYTVGPDTCSHSVHAEVSCLRNADISNAHCCLIMYVVRVNNFGDLQESKPCASCQSVLKKFNINRVFHSTSGCHLEGTHVDHEG